MRLPYNYRGTEKGIPPDIMDHTGYVTGYDRRLLHGHRADKADHLSTVSSSRMTLVSERSYNEEMKKYSIRGKLIKLMKIPGMPGLFIRLWDPMTKRIFGSGNGFKNVFYPKKKSEYRMDVISCPYNRFFTELGCPEVTKIFCENDERVYGNLPGLKFERTGTLGKGAARCDFYLRKV